jgi:hypothetical protein
MSTIEFLRRYQEWRRGDEGLEQPDPQEIGRHIDAAIKRLEELESNSAMLGRICGVVHEFAEEEEDTTLMCVARLRARFYDAMSQEAWGFVDKLEREAK